MCAHSIQTGPLQSEGEAEKKDGIHSAKENRRGYAFAPKMNHTDGDKKMEE